MSIVLTNTLFNNGLNCNISSCAKLCDCILTIITHHPFLSEVVTPCMLDMTCRTLSKSASERLLRSRAPTSISAHCYRIFLCQLYLLDWSIVWASGSAVGGATIANCPRGFCCPWAWQASTSETAQQLLHIQRRCFGSRLYQSQWPFDR